MKQRIVITGVAGFIGSNLAIKLIEEGFEVIGIDNLSYGLIEQVPKEVSFYNIDIRSDKISEIIKESDIIFHLAAKNCISDCEMNPIETISINMLGSMNLFDHAKKNKAKKFIFADSSAVYEGSDSFPSNENNPNPLSCYAYSKYFTSKFYNLYQKDCEMKLIGLRYFNVYGPRQDYRRSVPPVMSAFILKLLKGERPLIYGKNEKRRDFIHVNDINRFHLLCINNDEVDNSIFNLGTGKNYSVEEILCKISDIMSVNIDPIYEDELPGEADNTLADISRAKHLGWSPKIDIYDGLLNMIEYIKENKIQQKF